jgi:hypothetical protein
LVLGDHLGELESVGYHRPEASHVPQFLPDLRERRGDGVDLVDGGGNDDEGAGNQGGGDDDDDRGQSPPSSQAAPLEELDRRLEPEGDHQRRENHEENTLQEKHDPQGDDDADDGDGNADPVARLGPGRGQFFLFAVDRGLHPRIG